MIFSDDNVRVWLYQPATDMRNSFRGLIALVKNKLVEDPLSGQLFVFVNKRKTYLKILYYSHGGFCIWMKGRVERSIRYIRSSFFAGRQWTDIDDLNSQAKAWCLTQSKNRPCPEDNSMTVGAAFQLEQPKLIALPDNPFRG